MAEARLTDQEQLALDLCRGQVATAASITRAADAVGPDLARWAFTQWELRKRAIAKFSNANKMFFAREALEQATHEAVAAYHASRFPQDQLVLDLTAGIGGDAIALGLRGPMIGYELDTERARYASLNLGAAAAQGEIHCGDGTSQLGQADLIWIDPARRTAGRRVRNLNEFAPNIVEILADLKRKSLVGIKLTPMLRDEMLRELDGAIEFISYGGECREAVVWLGLGQTGAWAVHIESGDRLPRGPQPAPSDRLDAFIYEADPAAIRAHALGALCEDFNLSAVGDSNGFLTGSASVDSAWLTRFRLVGELPFDVKSLRQHIQSNNLRPESIKPRGVEIDPAAILKQVKNLGEIPVEILVARIKGRVRALIVEREVARLEPKSGVSALK